MNTEYDIVQLLVALDIDITRQFVNNGKIIIVIRYLSLYLSHKQDPFLIYFALGDNASLRCVIGIPKFLTLDRNCDIVKDELSCSEINRKLLLLWIH